MKWLSLIALGLLGSSLGFASQPKCPDLDLAGTWENGWNVQFEIQQPSCQEITVRDVQRDTAYHLSLDGKPSSSFDGAAVENAPAMMRWIPNSDGKYEEHRTPLLKTWGLSGQLVKNPYFRPENPRESRMMVEANISTDILLPKPGSKSGYFSLQGSVKAKIATYATGSDTELNVMYIYFQEPKITSIQGKDGSESLFLKGFLTGINALLHLYDFTTSNDDGYLSGPRMFREFVDNGSRSLRRIN